MMDRRQALAAFAVAPIALRERHPVLTQPERWTLQHAWAPCAVSGGEREWNRRNPHLKPIEPVVDSLVDRGLLVKDDEGSKVSGVEMYWTSPYGERVARANGVQPPFDENGRWRLNTETHDSPIEEPYR